MRSRRRGEHDEVAVRRRRRQLDGAVNGAEVRWELVDAAEPQTMAVSAVLICAAAPIGLVLSGWALAHFQTRSVIAAVLGLQTIAVLAIVAAALGERSELRSAPVDSPA